MEGKIHDQQNMILTKLSHQEWTLENEIEMLKMYTQQFAKIDTLKMEKGTGGQWVQKLHPKSMEINALGALRPEL